MFIINYENAWNWLGRPICPLSTDFSVNSKSTSRPGNLELASPLFERDPRLPRRGYTRSIFLAPD
jgi:hypothetical protein